MVAKENHKKKKNESVSNHDSTVSSSVSGNDKSSTLQLLSIITILLLVINFIAVLFILGSSTQTEVPTALDGEIVEKITRLDNFFAANFPDYLDPNAVPPTQQQPSAPPANLEVSLDGVRMIGDENAPVTIVKYSDFKCGFCGRFNDETYPSIYEEYIQTGLVKFVYKDFPVVGGSDAANAAWCAHEQGKFWEFKEGLFALGSGMSDVTMANLASELGLDVDQYTQCYEEERYSQNIQTEAAEAQANGVTGTPAFVIDGNLVVGAQPYNVFRDAIEAALN